MAKIFVMSNIHGRYEEMKEIMRQVDEEMDLDSFDHILFLGDYIGYGRKNEEVIQFLMELKQSRNNVLLLKGDWEEALYQTERGNTQEERLEGFRLFVQHGQADVVNYLRIDPIFLHEWLEEINKMPLAYVVEDYFFCHSGLNFEYMQEVETLEEFVLQIQHEKHLWTVGNEYSYYQFCEKYDASYFPFHIVMGQTPIHQIAGDAITTKYNRPFLYRNLYCIDFGAMYHDGRLGAVVFDGYETKTYTADVEKTKTKK